ncbi:transcriptional regulator [Parapedobacter defluvii]|uniref:Transcriptional regulator n=1 Tax=Parapedobacter defluvii TaxID=2045106 RepID=A0ABQ1LXC6_9SPHI|nr:GntR family transcriptional regulator [Parapedobacter defluvii]RQP17793.1 MAG: GntR family transcriptional regulator [Parapedobacter sp.]GGC31382.1 transcriptional regulator [Parapedobacter defluvii]
MKISLDHDSPLPLYVQIEEQLRKAIRSADYKNGKKLPNEVDLSKQLGVSRSTLRQAINKMVYEGLLIRRKGVGTVVANTAITSKANNWMSFTQEMRALGITVKNYELYIGWVKPTEELCTFFDIGPDTKVMKLERLRGNEERPFVYFISYFNPRIGLTGNEDFSRPLYDILENEHNTIAKLSKEEISAMTADALLAQKLELKVGDPILKRKRYVYDPGSRPIEWNVGYYGADSFVYTIESTRDI